MKNTNRELLDPSTNHQYVHMTLYLQDVKILYNACLDILDEHPEMIGYKQTAKKLKKILEKKFDDLPF